MTEEQYVAVSIDPRQYPHHPYGILDRKSGQVARFDDKESLDDSLDKLITGSLFRGNFIWTSGVEVAGELGPVPELIKPAFEDYSLTDDCDDTLVIVRAAGHDNRNFVAVVETAEAGVFVDSSQAPEVAAALLRACGLDPETTDLPTK